MKRALVVMTLLVLASGMLAGCAADTQEPVEILDNAIHDVERALGRYVQIDPNGPAEEVRRATDRVSSAWSTVVDAAADVDEIDISDAQAAHDALIEAVEDIDDDMAAGEAYASIEEYVDAFEEQVDEVHDALDVH